MKYLKLFQTNAQYTEYIEGDAILPNVSSIVGSGVGYKPAPPFTFTINGTAYQARKGMTFYTWAMSKYYDSSCRLNLKGGIGNLRDDIIEDNVSFGDSVSIKFGTAPDITPAIYTDTIIQPIAYTPNFGGFDAQ